jgi:hypothetical protein
MNASDSQSYLGRQVPFKSLVDCNPIHVGIVNEPNDLIAKQLPVVLRAEVRLGGFTRVQLQPLTDALAQDVERWIRLHNLGHRLLEKWLSTRNVVPESAVQGICEIDRQKDSRRRWVNGHVVGGVVKELRSSISLDIMRVKVPPSQLHVDPVLVGRCAVVVVLRVVQQAWLRHLPLVRSKENQVGAARRHLVRFPWMNRF